MQMSRILTSFKLRGIVCENAKNDAIVRILGPARHVVAAGAGAAGVGGDGVIEPEAEEIVGGVLGAGSAEDGSVHKRGKKSE